MVKTNIRVLLIIEQCNPDQISVPLLGFHFFRELSKRANVTLCTHGRNRTSLERVRESDQNIVYLHESIISKYYYPIIQYLTTIGGINWPLYHALIYPIYAEFNRNVCHRFKNEVMKGNFDIVHAFTPIIPRYPVKISEVCHRAKTPFLLGPVNGGLPFPTGFEAVSQKEFAQFNFLRFFTHFIPGYNLTYQNADKILAGSTYTLHALQRMFDFKNQKLELFYENGLLPSFFNSENERRFQEDPVELLFLGRLVPYKGADIVIEAFSRLPDKIKSKARLKIVGDGPEKDNLKNLASTLKVDHSVKFTGWVKNEDTVSFYKNADIFCFPSLREFGGAVVLEAMASGLPCIIVDHGGISEYVTDKTGIKIPPKSKEFIIDELKKGIELLIENPNRRKSFSYNSIQRAHEFEWGKKADKMIKNYEELIRTVRA